MAIISISISDENLEALDGIQRNNGLRGRSEAIRKAISSAMDDDFNIDAIEGDVEGVLIVIKKNHSDPWIALIQQKYESSIKTQLHSHLKDKKCLEVMIISTDSDTLRDILKEIWSSKKADYVKFVKS